MSAEERVRAAVPTYHERRSDRDALATIARDLCSVRGDNADTEAYRLGPHGNGGVLCYCWTSAAIALDALAEAGFTVTAPASDPSQPDPTAQKQTHADASTTSAQTAAPASSETPLRKGPEEPMPYV